MSRTGRTYFARHEAGEVHVSEGTDEYIVADTIIINPTVAEYTIGHQAVDHNIHERMHHTQEVMYDRGPIYGARFRSGSFDIGNSMIEHLEKIFMKASMKRFKYCGDCIFDCKKVRKKECALKVKEDLNNGKGGV